MKDGMEFISLLFIGARLEIRSQIHAFSSGNNSQRETKPAPCHFIVNVLHASTRGPVITSTMKKIKNAV